MAEILSPNLSAPLGQQSFEAIMHNYADNIKDAKIIAVGVSGGGDSMALAHLLAKYCAAHDKVLHIVSVNHQLRDAAQEEVLQVGAWVKDWPNTTHHILNWDHEQKPDSRIQESARSARYDLLCAHCTRYDISALFIAHHLDDQYETFLMRLTSGSGLKGLAAMAEISATDNNAENKVVKIRPLIHYTHNDLIDYCQRNAINWIEDPSNQDTHYKRVRFRNAAAFLSEEGLSTKRVDTLITRISRANKALAYYTAQELGKVTTEETPISQTIDLKLFLSLPDEIALSILGQIMRQLNKSAANYPPSAEKLESLYTRISNSRIAFQGATLYKCQFSLRNKGAALHIAQE
jgi:tRNA(Ile)-lysidine synthase